MIPLFKPKVHIEKAMELWKEACESGWIGLGPRVAEFEAALAKYFEVEPRQVICTANGTAALHLAVCGLGLTRDRYVATTPITFVSTNHVLLYEHLLPHFVDVNHQTGCMDFHSLTRALAHRRISAVMYVHLGGSVMDFSEINALCADADVPLIEDCAHAMGQSYAWKSRVGNSQNVCCFSFHAVKNLTCGEGGCIVVPQGVDDTVYRQMRWMGIDQDTISRSKTGYKWEYGVPWTGYKYHMSDMAACMGLANLPHLDAENARRVAIANQYSDAFDVDFGGGSCHFLPTLFENRDEVAAHLTKEGIGCGMHYKRNDQYPMYKAFTHEDLEGAEWYEKRELTLPLHCHLNDEMVLRIICSASEVGKTPK